MTNIQISDFFGSYPSFDEESLSSKIAAKQEFRELTLEENEPFPEKGKYFKYQLSALRLAIEYDRILSVADPGTGKSCTLTLIAEHLKKIYFANPLDKTVIKKAYVLVKNKFLEQNIIDAISCKCTTGIYDIQNLTNAVDEKSIKAAVNKLLKEWYSIMTYYEFAKKIRSFTREDDLETFMSNIVVFVDEIHNVVTLQDIRRAQIEIEDLDETDLDLTKESVYDTLFRAFHKGKRNKIYGFTATPMINKPADIRPLINLFLPDVEGKRMPNFTDDQMDQITLEQIQKYFLGIVLYVRAADTGAIPTNPDGSAEIDGYYTKVFPISMSIFQYLIYLQSMGGNNISLNSMNLYLDSESKSSAFFDKQRNISNFVFPNGSFGVAGSDTYIEKAGSGYQIKNDANGNNLKENMKLIPVNPNEPDGLTRLDILSPKFAEIIRICQSRYSEVEPYQIEADIKKGVIFIFFPDFVMGSAALTLSKALEENGYMEFREVSTIFMNTNYNTTLTACPSDNSNIVNGKRVIRSSRIVKSKRYALLTGKTTEAQIKTIIDTNHAYENRYGQYLQVIIGSKAAREGINIHNAVAFIRASSGWNPSTDRQARDRVFRADSHEMRLAEIHGFNLAQGTIEERTKIPVDVYNMASIYLGDEELTPDKLKIMYPGTSDEQAKQLLPTLQTNNIDLVDIQMYKRAEKKDRSIQRIFRFMKQCSIDCVINYNRNVRPGDINNSPTCDYTVCQYTCAQQRQDIIQKIDKTTKILLYSGEEVSLAISQIKNLFSQNYSLSISQIYSLIPGIESVYITMALEKMITENIRIVDRFGIFGYLREGNQGIIYIEKDPFAINTKQENVYYNASIIGTLNSKINLFGEYMKYIFDDLTPQMLNNLMQMNYNSFQFENAIMNLSLNNKIKLVETGLTNPSNAFYTKILSIFSNFIFFFLEPLSELEKIGIEESIRSKGRGRPSKKEIALRNATPVSTTSNLNTPLVGERVTMHILNVLRGIDTQNFNLLGKYKKADCIIRLYKPSENIGFRNANNVENIVYANLISKEIETKLSIYDQYPFYGISFDRNVINIRQNNNTNKTLTDERYKNTSKICASYSKPEILEMLYDLKISPNVPVPGNWTRDQYIADIRSKIKGEDTNNYNFNAISDDLLIFMYKWYTEGTSRVDLCYQIEEKFNQTGRVFNLFNLTANEIPINIPVISPSSNSGSYLSPIAFPTSTIPISTIQPSITTSLMSPLPPTFTFNPQVSSIQQTILPGFAPMGPLSYYPNLNK